MYDPVQTYKMALKANIAYMDGANTGSLYVEVDDVQAHVWISEASVEIAFRGTEKSFKDIKRDLDLKTVETPIGKAHGGFCDAWDQVKRIITDILNNNKGKKIYFIGHSLGGAIAVRAAIDFPDHYIAGVYTFGQPRVFFNGSANKYPLKAVTWRVVNDADIVSRMPPATLGWRHVGQEVLITGNGKVIVNPSIWRRILCFLVEPIGGKIRDHSLIYSYCKQLEKEALK